MYRLRYPQELKKMQEVPGMLEVKADKEQLKLARTLVDSMVRKFSQIKMEDHYYDALKEIIDAKIQGREIVSVEEKEPEVTDIMTALKASIERAKKKPMEKAKGTARQAAKKKETKTLKRKAG
jgi:DNA end-binding protein Ku